MPEEDLEALWSQAQPIAATDTGVKSHIASIESGGSYTAQNPTSSAYGKYQIIDDTNNSIANKLGVSVEELKTPAGQEMAMNYLTEEYTGQLKDLGVEPTKENIYVVHQLGYPRAKRYFTNSLTQDDINVMEQNLPQSKRGGDTVSQWSSLYAGATPTDNTNAPAVPNNMTDATIQPDTTSPTDLTNEDLEALWSQAQPVSQVQDTTSNMQPQESTGVIEDIPRQLGLTLRAGAEGLAGTAGIVTDPMAEIINTALPDEYKIGKLKESVGQILTDMGVPEPQGATERIVQQVSQALTGSGGLIKAGAGLGAGAITETGKAVGKTLTEKAAQQAGGAIGGTLGAEAGATGAEELGFGETGQAVAQIGGALIGGGLGYKSVSDLKNKAVTKDALKTIVEKNPDNAEVATLKVVGNKAVPDPAAIETIKQGLAPKVVSAIKAGSNKDRFNMKRMMAIHKKAQKDAVYAANNRPTDVVGKSLNDRIDFLFKANRKAGSQIEKAANKLKGTKVDTTDIDNNFMTKLEDTGARVAPNDDGKIVFSLKGSDIEGDNASRSLLNKIFDRTINTNTSDAYDLHRLKRFIDTQVSYGKSKANPLSKATERIVKDLRRDINAKLGEISSSYKVANEKYSDTIGALDDIQKAAGTSINMQSENAPKSLGTVLRGLLSNNKTRIALKDSVVNAENVAKKYGMNIDDSLDRQIIFANELDRMFGTAAKTSFQGGIEQGIEAATRAARGGAFDTAMSLGKTGIEKARGINENNAIKAIENLLKEAK